MGEIQDRGKVRSGEGLKVYTAELLKLSGVGAYCELLSHTIDENLAKPNKDICSLLTLLEEDFINEDLEDRTSLFLNKLQEADSESITWSTTRRKRQARYGYPGVAEDKFFQPSYCHRHHL